MKIKKITSQILALVVTVSLAIPVFGKGTDTSEKSSLNVESIEHFYDELDYQRAVQAYLWSIPAMYMYSLRKSLVETFGATPNRNVPLWGRPDG